jgi:hypothetical protein
MVSAPLKLDAALANRLPKRLGIPTRCLISRLRGNNLGYVAHSHIKGCRSYRNVGRPAPPGPSHPPGTTHTPGAWNKALHNNRKDNETLRRKIFISSCATKFSPIISPRRPLPPPRRRLTDSFFGGSGSSAANFICWRQTRFAGRKRDSTPGSGNSSRTCCSFSAAGAEESPEISNLARISAVATRR